MKRVCVFCGSSPGARPSYRAAAEALGAAIARRGLGLVYGGAHVGLMGVVADAALAAGGDVIGVQLLNPCNADPLTRASIEQAVKRAAPLPYKGYEKAFQRQIDFNFTYDG